MEEQKKQDVASHSLESEFVTYEQALALKELGFDEECMAGYDKEDNTLYIAYLINAGVQFNSHYYDKAPLKQQVFRWFREKYELYINIYQLSSHDKYWDSDLYKTGVYRPSFIATTKTYEEAENAAINKLIEIVNQ